MNNCTVPSFGYISSPEDLFKLIAGEAMENGNLSIRGVSRLADVQHTSLVRDGAFNSQSLAETLIQHGFDCGALMQDGFPPAAVILVLEYFAYESKAKAPGAKLLMRLFGAIGLKEVLGKLKQPEPAPTVKALPARDSIDYVHAAAMLPELKVNNQLKQLLEDALTDDLELMRNKLLLSGDRQKKEYTIVKVRAKELGYKVNDISTGSQLGKFVKRQVDPAFAKRIGDYNVNHYEVGSDLDEAIHAFFR